MKRNPGLHYRLVETAWGAFVLAASEQGLAAVDWPSKRPLRLETSSSPILRQAGCELEAYVNGKLRAFSVPLDPQGTPFQKRVWKALGRVAYGRTITYGELARRIGKPGAARAVGNAAGRNPLPIVSPCHRLLAAGEGLGGFSGGLAWKRRLLDREGIRINS